MVRPPVVVMVLSSLLDSSSVAAELLVLAEATPSWIASVVLFGFSVTAPLPELIALVSIISSAISAMALLVVARVPPFCVSILSLPITFSVAPAGAVTLPLNVMSLPLVSVTVEPAPAVIEPALVTFSAPLVARLVLPVVSTAALMVVVPAEGVVVGTPVAPCDCVRVLALKLA